MLASSTRNRIGFLLLGLTNNYGYVIMLTAAYDLLSPPPPPPGPDTIAHATPYCNKRGTSTILLADTLPSLLIKLVYPFLLVQLPTALLVVTCVASTVTSYMLVAFAGGVETLIFVGVCFASVSSGIGEPTFLSLTPQFKTAALGGWSVGTGFAGILGALAYTLLSTSAKLETRTIMLIMIVAPATMAVAYFAIVKADFPDKRRQKQPQEPQDGDRSCDGSCRLQLPTTGSYRSIEPQSSPPKATTTVAETSSSDELPLSFGEKLEQMPGLARFFAPLLLVYFAEYFINQGLFELMYFPQQESLNKKAQYKWFSVTYQLGVFVSRSSIEFVHFNNLWLMCALQFVNLAIFLLHVLNVISLPSFSLAIAIVFYEGLLGGLAYVNTFSRVRREVVSRSQEFAITTVTISDTLGIVLASFSAMPSHDFICDKFYSHKTVLL